MSKMKNKNLTIKTLALFISILLWSYVRSEVNPKIVREFKGINVEIMNQRILNDSNLLVLKPKEVKVSVKVSGRRSDVNSISAADITAEVDLSGATEGTQKIPIDVKIPFKVDLEDVSKRYVSFEIDKLTSVNKEVEINVKGENKEDTIKESSISPNLIKINGPSLLIEKIARVIVDIDVDKVNSNGIMKLPVKAVDRKGNKIEGLEISPNMVEVSLSVSRLKTKQVIIKPKVIGNLNNDLKLTTVSTNPSTVTIRGLEENIKNISQIETEEIDLKNIQSNQNIKTKLIIPKGISVDSENETVTVILKIDTSQNKDLNKELEKEILVPINQISLENVKEGFKASLSSNLGDNVSIRIKGEEKIVDSFKSGDLNLSLNLDGLVEGTHNVKLIVSSLKEITIQNIAPEIIETKIEAL